MNYQTCITFLLNVRFAVPWFHVGCTEKRCQTEVIIFMWLTTARTAYRHFYGAYVILVCTLHNDWNHTLVAVSIMTYCSDWSTRRLRFFMWRRLIGMYSRLVLRAQHSSKLTVVRWREHAAYRFHQKLSFWYIGGMEMVAAVTLSSAALGWTIWSRDKLLIFSQPI